MDDPIYYSCDLDLQQGYSRPKLVYDSDEELSSYVTNRLALARELAMQKYREIYVKA